MADFLERAPQTFLNEGWSTRKLDGGEILWNEGEEATELGWLKTGELEVVVGDSITARVGPQSMLGEAAAFSMERQRMATVRAVRPSELWLLSTERLLALREQGHPSYDQLLADAVQALAQRIEAINQRVVAHLRRPHKKPPTPAGAGNVETSPPSVVGRAPPPPPSAEPLLLALLGADTKNEVLVPLAQSLLSRWLPKQGLLCREGEAADSMFIVASGVVGAERASEKGSSVRLAELPPGSLIGTNAMVEGGVRGATLRGLRSGWLFELRREAAEALPPTALRAVREALLLALRHQLLGANSQLRELQGPRGSLSLGDALGAIGSLQGIALGPGFELVTESPVALSGPRAADEKDALLAYIRSQVIGADQPLTTPFGKRRVVYADYTASGRSLGFIESFLRDRVLPMYANTHTEASASGLQTTRFREEARALVAQSVGAGPEDAVVFVGSGATGAINKLIDILGLRVPADLDARLGIKEQIPSHERPVVFIGPYEHHSNILPWRHSLADLCVVPLDAEGRIDTQTLEEMLLEYADRPLKIGSFSAASNVTGTSSDVRGIAELLHLHGALSFWDYAAAGPYVRITMNPEPRPGQLASPHKDAIFLSPHKFVGGPGTPGVLVVKRAIVKNTVPTQPGGGTVDYVDAIDSVYTSSIEHREEAGTPAIVESIRCGLVFQLKDTVGADTIEARESSFVRSAITRWLSNPAIRVLGNPNLHRLSIVSFMIRYGERFLHHNFVIALLNDVFGLQARGGCSCAGPYGAVLLGLEEELSESFKVQVDRGYASLKPGWARVNFNYFISETEFRYIVEAVDLVARYGWALLPDYEFDLHSGLWKYQRAESFVPQSLSSLSCAGDHFSWPTPEVGLPESALEEQLSHARNLLRTATERSPQASSAPELPAEFHALRWFPLPHEVSSYLRAKRAGNGLVLDHFSRAPINPGPSSVRATSIGCAQD